MPIANYHLSVNQYKYFMPKIIFQTWLHHVFSECRTAIGETRSSVTFSFRGIPSCQSVMVCSRYLWTHGRPHTLVWDSTPLYSLSSTRNTCQCDWLKSEMLPGSISITRYGYSCVDILRDRQYGHVEYGEHRAGLNSVGNCRDRFDKARWREALFRSMWCLHMWYPFQLMALIEISADCHW